MTARGTVEPSEGTQTGSVGPHRPRLPPHSPRPETHLMLLDRINSPADLRGLDLDQLDALAAEIRTFIVDAVDAAGSGHLGSNLGAVELTLALPPVFDPHKDRLLWDTGHQDYQRRREACRARRRQ